MKSLNKSDINKSFREALFFIAVQHKIRPSDLTLSIRYVSNSKCIIQLCKLGTVIENISILELFNAKMIGLRFTPEKLLKLFKVVHNAFLIETSIDNPSRISLVLYQSEVAHCTAIGIKADEKVLKVLRISDVIEAIEFESEQLN